MSLVSLSLDDKDKENFDNGYDYDSDDYLFDDLGIRLDLE